jgi:hypothetical protein
MRFFILKLKIRRFEALAPKAAAEMPPVSIEARAALNYNILQKAALTRERRAINVR